MLVVQYPSLADDEDELDDDVDFMKELETLAQATLRASGLGTDFGNGTINVFCEVRDAGAPAACAALVAALDGEGIDGAVIAFVADAVEDAEPVVLYPEDYRGRFSVI